MITVAGTMGRREAKARIHGRLSIAGAFLPHRVPLMACTSAAITAPVILRKTNRHRHDAGEISG
jgi:hypothetical protein